MFVIYLLPITVEAILWDTRAVSSKLVALVTYIKDLNSDLTIDIWKKKKEKNGETRRRIRLNKGFKVESRDMKLC